MHHHFTCPARSTAPRQVRRQVTAALREDLDPERLALVELLVSELATNVVLHGGDEMSVDITSEDQRVRVEVADPGEELPRRRRPGSDADHGRGLGLVADASAAWGVRRCPEGKGVWFELHRL